MFKKAKKSIAWLAVLVLAFSLFAGYFATIQFASAAYATARNPKALFSGMVDTKVEYGESFDVPVVSDNQYTLSVKSPNGKAVAPVSNKVLATQLGIYEVSISRTSAWINGLGDKNDNGTYKYNVQCYLDGDHVLVVDKGGATIPTYWKESADIKIKLPDANVYAFDEDEKEYVKDNGQIINLTVTAPDGTVTNKTLDHTSAYASEMALNKRGTWFFTYSSAISTESSRAGSADGTYTLTKQYTAQVQEQFEDDKAPTLSRPSLPPTTASVNTKVNIPTVNASDNYDTRVIVDISVKHTYNAAEGAVNVKKVDVDEKTGYVARNVNNNPIFKDKDNLTTTTRGNAEDVLFDNDMFMYFYPTETGTYTVTYRAEDTSHFYSVGKNNKNVTIEYVYTINVTDTTAPVFDKIDDYKIPTDWGVTVEKYDFYNVKSGTDSISITDPSVGKTTNVEFPIPDVYDNSSAPDKITVSFNFTDNNGRTVAYFSDINAKTHSDANRYSGTYLKSVANSKPYYFFRVRENNAVYSVAADGLITVKATGEQIGYDFATAFNFANWKPEYTGASVYNSYSIVYRAYDETGINYQPLSYSVRYSASYVDTTAPEIYFVAPKFINFTKNKEEVNITGVSVADTQSSRVKSEYYIVFGTNSDFLDPDGNYDGTDFNNMYNSVPAERRVKLSSTLGTNTMKVQKTAADGCKVTVTNDEGIKTEIKNITGKYAYVIIRATDSVGNESYRVSRIGLVDATGNPGNTVKSAITAKNTATAVGTSGTQYLFGDFEIEFQQFNDRKQTGFEVYVQRVSYEVTKNNGTEVVYVDESPLTDVEFETYSANVENGDNKIYVDNLRFAPHSAGTYMIVIRAYHVSGLSESLVSYVDIKGTTTGTGSTPSERSNTISTTGDLNVTYSLKNVVTAEAGQYIVTSIKGGRMSLMYDQLTAMSRTTYTVKDYSVTPGGNNNVNYSSAYKPLNGATAVEAKQLSNYSTAVSDHEVPEIRVQGVMPVYTKAEGALVTLPSVSATSKNGIASKVDCKVTDHDGSPVTVTEAVGNVFKFNADKDGTYTITYTATLNGNVATESFTIKAGDVIAPVFKVVEAKLTNYRGDAVIGYINDQKVLVSSSSSVTATIGDEFKFGVIECSDESTSNYTYLKQLISADNEVVDSVTSASLRNNSSKITFTMSGQYTVVYSVTDQYGNTATVKYYITVNSTSINVSTEAITTLSVVLIIVGVILIAGVVIYLVRFRKHKKA